MSLSDLDLAERRALATPHDFPDDFDNDSLCWNVCERCNHVFLGIPRRIHCRECEKPCSSS